jgi:phosphoribulokinase
MANLREKLLSRTSPIVIGIAGDSGSGKTTYSNGIRRLLGVDVVKTITMDGYHRETRAERERSGRLPLDPSANKLELLVQHLTLLTAGKTVAIPIYNHKTGEFDPASAFTPSPVVIIEGLHALYPEIMPFIHFGIYVDPCREVKWQWKYERDLKKRGHASEQLKDEMHKREAAYKRWIDFQKTSANVVIKIFPSRVRDLARYELIGDIPECCYKVELMIDHGEMKLPTIPLPFDLSTILGSTDQPPFMLAAIPSLYWGKTVTVVHTDGILSQETVSALEQHIVSLTGIPVDKMLETQYVDLPDGQNLVTAVQFAQLLIAWRFLELVEHVVDRA